MSSCSPLGEDTPPPGASQGRVVVDNHPRADQPDDWPGLDSPPVSGMKSYQGGTSHRSRSQTGSFHSEMRPTVGRILLPIDLKTAEICGCFSRHSAAALDERTVFPLY